MKITLQKLFLKLSGLLACMAMFFAMSSTSNTCMFMLYQPDVPKELL